MLGIQAAALLLHGSERTAHRNGGKSAGCILGNIHIGRQFNAIAVMKSNFTVVDKFGLGEGLVPLPGKIQCAHILVCV